jgi:hypothetical protein
VEVGEIRRGKILLEDHVLACGEAAGLEPVKVLIHSHPFTKTSRCWGIENNKGGTNTHRIAISMRRTHPALSFGSLRWLKVDDGQISIAFLRETPEQKILIALNRHDQPQTLRIPAPEGWTADNQAAFFTSDGSTATLKKNGTDLELVIPSLTAAVFKQ